MKILVVLELALYIQLYSLTRPDASEKERLQLIKMKVKKCYCRFQVTFQGSQVQEPSSEVRLLFNADIFE